VREAIDRHRYAYRKIRSGLQCEAGTEGDHFSQYGPFFVDLKKHLATLNGQPLELTSREFALLAHLIQNVDRVVPAEELVWVVREYKPEHAYEAQEIIKWYIHRLRRKVEPDPADPRYILNVRGVGYRLGK
jgi:DNA-binding response OmpR family regulator